MTWLQFAINLGLALLQSLAGIFLAPSLTQQASGFPMVLGVFAVVWYLGMIFLVAPLVGNSAIRAAGNRARKLAGKTIRLKIRNRS